MPAAFEISNLRKSYGRRPVLDIGHAEFAAGEITALVGPNGCGKTTLLEILNGLLKPDSGDIRFFGGPLNHDARSRMTMVFQTPRLFHGTVAYNVGYGLRLRGQNDPQEIDNALKSVRLEEFETRAARRLSGGETKRVAIARALAISPEILILDEPTSNVDIENTAVIENAVRSLCETRGITVILSTHSREQAASLAHNVLLLDEGRLSPYYPENQFHASLASGPDGKVLLIGEKTMAFVETDLPPGGVLCVIPPQDIFLSGASPQIKEKNTNHLSGEVVSIIKENGGVRITVNAGVPLNARITIEAYRQLHPSIGDTLHLSFKASSIKVF